ncbi:hypothetical protein [Actinomadura sp. NBRC 104412]|uniref:hypothetical protein n=1 Tax=Actinomadura sp. NBRC 104412 TaxID=3032203 RepID=UPI0025534674|nr:hypothetical protein [Actinomadura sp. NBRC 104412]
MGERRTTDDAGAAAPSDEHSPGIGPRPPSPRTGHRAAAGPGTGRTTRPTGP